MNIIKQLGDQYEMIQQCLFLQISYIKRPNFATRVLFASNLTRNN